MESMDLSLTKTAEEGNVDNYVSQAVVVDVERKDSHDDAAALSHVEHHMQEKKNHAVAVSATELFFDLIFVAVVIEIGQYLKRHIDWLGVASTFGLFTVFWLTWFHTNLILTRFRMRRTRTAFVFLIILTSLLVAVHAVDEADASTAGSLSNETVILYLILVANRLLFLGAYLIMFIRKKITRPMLLRYIIGLSISCGLLFVGGVINHPRTSMYFAIGAMLAEIIMYPLALSIKEDDKLAVSNEHLLERNHLWVILILGESVISLITTEHNDFEERFYWVEILGSILVYFILLTHTKSQVFLREVHGLEYRPIPYLFTNLSLLIMSAGLLGIGVSMKLMVMHSGDDHYVREYGFLHTGAIFTVFLGINMARLVQQIAARKHRQERRPEDTIPLFGRSRFAWILASILNIAVVPLAYVTHEHHDRPTLLLILTVIHVGVLFSMEWMFKPSKSGKFFKIAVKLEEIFTPHVAEERRRQNAILEEQRRAIKARPENVYRLLPQRLQKMFTFGEEEEDDSPL